MIDTHTQMIITTMDDDERQVVVPVERWINGAAEIGDHCTHCGRSTIGDHGRIPSERQDEGTHDYPIDGWLCTPCQQIECALCGQKTTDHETHPSEHVLGFVCGACATLYVGEGPAL